MDNAGEAVEHPNRRSRRLRRRSLAVLSVLALGVAACGGDDDDGGDDASTDDTEATGGDNEDLLGPEEVAEGDPIKIGMVGDGVTEAFDNTDELLAAEAAGEYWNQHQGGVAGQPVDVVTCETGGDPAKGTDCGNRMVEEGVVAVALSQSGVADSVYEPVHAAGIPAFFLQTSAEALLEDTETSFTMFNPLGTLFGLPFSLAQDEGTEQITFVNIDVPQALTLFESGQADAMAENAGLEIELVKIAPGTADMTSQMQEVASSGSGVVYIVGNDAFCISAIQGLNAVGYDGTTSGVVQCITDATREALPGGELEGFAIGATTAAGDDDNEAYERYVAVMDEYGDVTDVENALGMGGYATMASLLTALEGLEGEVTPESVAEALRTMDEADYPGSDGITFQCGGSAYEVQPAVCTNQALSATLDADGNPSAYEVTDFSDILP
jgi:branched-chain amino acid transport system substrate-binding protein